MNSTQVDVIIIGAGAAGLMCAIEAGRRNRSVLLLDHADRPGKKILISGGGRCNFTNLHTSPENFLSSNPHFARSALARYTPVDFIALVEKHSVPYHEKTLGQLFCDHSAQAIVTMLTQECAASHVQTILSTGITSVSRTSTSGRDRFLVETSRGTWNSASLVIATGGLSIPRMGATSFGYDIARQFGLGVIDCRPGLVPLVLPDPEQQHWSDLSGLSAEVVATAGAARLRTSFREKLLITHRGLSGPVILQISSFWKSGTPITLDLVPGIYLTAPLRGEGVPRTPEAAFNALRAHLPARLAERWLRQNLPSSWTNISLDKLEHSVHNWAITPAGTEGYAKAEVTAGGVDTAELDGRTMQARHVPGLYFIGEVVDVTGWLGGYNFQWAWASGYAAGQAA